MGAVSLTARLALAAVFVVSVSAVAASAGGRRELTTMLAGVGVSARLTHAVAYALVAAESGVVVLAPWPRTGPTGAVLGLALTGGLTAGVAWAVRRGSTVECRCFGARGGRLGRAHVTRNAALTGVAAVAVATSVPAVPPVGPGPAVVCAAAAVLTAVLVVRWEDLYELLAGPAGRGATPAGGRKDVP